MNLDNAQGDGQIVKIKLPRSLVQRMAKRINPEEYNRFIVNAIEQSLIVEEQFAALEEPTAKWEQSPDGDGLPEDELMTWLNESDSLWNQAQQ